MPTCQILLADDDRNFATVMAYTLKEMGAAVTTVHNGAEAWALLQKNDFDLVLSDVRMPGLDGLALLAKIREIHTQVPVILITAHGDIQMAVEALQSGATDFIAKPFDREVLKEKIERALRLPRLERENIELRRELSGRYAFANIVGSSPAMQALLDRVERIAQGDSTVLILGESGTGKELVARALHYAGPRQSHSFVAINCAAIPPTLLESELFGHVKGAFTGADRNHVGRFEQASGGTIFLDEIGDMPPELQAKLLRVLQERHVEPVGSGELRPVNVRVIAATNRDIDQLVKEGSFRLDLYYRLHVVPLHIPPLRERLEDIPLLVRAFLKNLGEPDVTIEKEAIDKLMTHEWPGNVRELQNALERALALRKNRDRLIAEDFEVLSPSRSRIDMTYDLPEEGIVLDDLEKHLVATALRKTGRNQTRAARLLGISRQQLIYRMQKYGIE